MRYLLRLCCIALAAPIAVCAASVQDIKLSDGSMIRAEVVSLDNGIYTLRSSTMGELRIPAAEIRSIVSAKAASNAAPTASNEIEEMRTSLINDTQAMDKIHSLKNDPLVHNILNDEATMRAINSGNISALMNDPKIKALMNHTTIKELTRGVVP